MLEGLVNVLCSWFPTDCKTAVTGSHSIYHNAVSSGSNLHNPEIFKLTHYHNLLDIPRAERSVELLSRTQLPPISM
jgi:hypothetical protein